MVCDMRLPFSNLQNGLAARRSWGLRGVAGGVAEEARTRGFPSLVFTRFGFVLRSFVVD